MRHEIFNSNQETAVSLRSAPEFYVSPFNDARPAMGNSQKVQLRRRAIPQNYVRCWPYHADGAGTEMEIVAVNLWPGLLSLDLADMWSVR